MSDIFIHPTSIVETEQIGERTRIWAFTHIMDGVTIGTSCNIGEHCFIESGAVIGHNVTIKNANLIWDGITLEDGVFVGPRVCFTNDRYPRSPRLSQAEERYRGRAWLVPTLIQEGATLGAGAVILPGVTLGAFSMIGAGAVVTRDVPAYTLVIGTPARQAGWVCQCGQPLLFQGERARCEVCRRSYINHGDTISIDKSLSK